jgi:tetratricopeptide (TPR) repeat protein
MYLDRVYSLAGGPGSGWPEVERSLLQQWRTLGGGGGNMALLSAAFRSGAEAAPENLAVQVGKEQGLCLIADCQENGEYNLGLFRRWHRVALSLAAGDPDLGRLVDTYQATLDFLLGDSDYVTDFNARINKVFEVSTNYIDERLHTYARFWRGLLSLLAARSGRPPVLVINQLQWIDTYSATVIKHLLRFTLGERAMLILVRDPEIGNPAAAEVIEPLVREGCLPEIRMEPTAVVSESEMLDSFGRLSPAAQACCRLLATTTEELTEADLQGGWRALSQSSEPISPALPSGRFQLRACWKRLLARLPDEDLKKLHATHLERSHGSERNAPSARMSIVASIHCLASGRVRSLLDRYYQIGIDAYERFGDYEGGARFYQALANSGVATASELALLYGKLALLHSRLRNVELAQEEYVQALRLEEDPVRRAILRAQHLVLMSNQPARAAQMIEGLGSFAEQLSDNAPETRYARARLLNAQALIYHKTGDYKGALGVLREANILLRRAGSCPEVSAYRHLLLKNLAHICQQIPGRGRSVERYYRAALSVARAHGDQGKMLLCHLQLAAWRMACGDFYASEAILNAACETGAGGLAPVGVHHFAIQHYRRCRQTALEERWVYRLAEQYLSLGQMADVIDLLNQKGAEYYTRGLYRQSSGLFDRCLELASRPPASRLRHALFKAHTYRAVLASLSGDDSLSRQHLNQAIVVQSENSPGESASIMKLRQMQSLMKARG